MAETLALAPAQDPEALLNAAAIRSRFEQLSVMSRGDEKVSEAVVRAARHEYEVDLQAVDMWDSSAAELGSDGLDAYMEWLRKEVSLAEEENWKLSAEIGAVRETVFKDAIQLDADIEATKSSLDTIDSEGSEHLEASTIIGLSVSTDSYRNQSTVEDYKYEVLELDYQIGKSEMDLKLLEKQDISVQRAEAIRQLQSILSEQKVLDFKDNYLRVFLNAPMQPSECVIYGQKLDYVVDSFVSDHELLIEVDKESMELKKVQIIPDDMCMDILVQKLKSNRKAITFSSLGWLIRQSQHHIILNTLRRSLVNDANNSRHSFEYMDKDETIVAHLVGGIDAFIKISADWPLSSYGLKLISVRNSGTQPTNITLHLLCRTKMLQPIHPRAQAVGNDRQYTSTMPSHPKMSELVNGLELRTRRHLVRFVDAVEEILVREMQLELHSSRISG